MIYHTAAEVNYYNAFFKRWHQSILYVHPDAKFSLKFVGDTIDADVIEYTKTHNIDLILDPTTPEDLINKYGSIEAGCGYYPMARWNSIPDSDDVCVTDVDVVLLNDHLAEITELLNEHDVVSISRLKPNDKVNLMMINYIRKDVCAKVKNVAISLMNDETFRWDIDLDVMFYIKKNLNLIYINKLLKFDRGNDLVPDKQVYSYFGYYSAVPVKIDDIEYPGGIEAKKAKYEWSDKNNIFSFSNNQLSFQD